MGTKEEIYAKYFPEYDHSSDYHRMEYDVTVENTAELMIKYANEKTKHQEDVIEKLKNMSGILLERLEKRKPKKGYIFSVRIAIKDLERAVEEAESIIQETK